MPITSIILAVSMLSTTAIGISHITADSDEIPTYVMQLYNTPMSPDTPLTSWGEYADVGCLEESRIIDSGFDKLCRQWEESRNMESKQ